MSISDRSASGGALTRKGIATRARIVEAAASLVYENGVAGTSLEDVRELAGVSNSQLYHYFADKSDLVRAVVEHQSDRVVGSHEQLLRTVDAFSGLEEWRNEQLRTMCSPESHHGCPIGALASELAESDERAREALSQSFARWESAIGRALGAMRERGELRADTDPDRLALVVLAGLQGGLLLTQTHRTAEPVRAALDAALGYIDSFRTEEPC